MGKKKNSKAYSEEVTDTTRPLLEFRYGNPLFAIACHPEQSVIVSGLATGHMFCHKYNAAELKEAQLKRLRKHDAGSKDDRKKLWEVVEVPGVETSGVSLLWTTKRHKGSVRCICFDADGTHIYSVGTDNVLKKADTLTGKVVKKCVLDPGQNVKYTKLVKSATHPLVLLGDENGNVTVLNSESLEQTNLIKSIHNGDAINDIFHFAKKSVYRFISLGQTTLAHWDSRESNEGDFAIAADDKQAKRKVILSDDQEDEILCGTFVDPEDGEVLVCGMGEGVLTVWRPKKNGLADQLTRIKVKKNESIDCIVPTLEDDGCVWCGCSDGNIYKVHVNRGTIIEVRKHSKLDEVTFLDLDSEYRLLSGGLDKAKLWDSEKSEQLTPESDADDRVSNSSPSAGKSSESDSNDSENDATSSGGSSDEDSFSDESEHSDASDVEEELVGLTREQIIAELDKDLVEESEDVEDVRSQRKRKHGADLPTNANGKKQKGKNIKPERSMKTHGIRRFEGL
ncbi:FAEL261Cp [Eremothecium gossypii FDAG1]|nr:FAEL261Cp [Eremothecium gossypii FDAG1]